MLLGRFFQATADVKRYHQKEAQVGSTYTIIDKKFLDETATTTVSFNIADMILMVTTHNFVEWFPSVTIKEILDRTDLESLWHLIWMDTAGQERFDFMSEITIPGADAVIIFADGTNVESVVKNSYYVRLIRAEEKKTDRTMPIAIFLNKKDLAKKGVFLGVDIVRGMVSFEFDEYLIYETSVKEREGFNEPIRLIIDRFKPRRYSEIFSRAQVIT